MVNLLKDFTHYARDVRQFSRQNEISFKGLAFTLKFLKIS